MKNGIEVRATLVGWEVVILPGEAHLFASDSKSECEMIAKAYRMGYNKATWKIRDLAESCGLI